MHPAIRRPALPPRGQLGAADQFIRKGRMYTGKYMTMMDILILMAQRAARIPFARSGPRLRRIIIIEIAEKPSSSGANPALRVGQARRTSNGARLLPGFSAGFIRRW